MKEGRKVPKEKRYIEKQRKKGKKRGNLAYEGLYCRPSNRLST